MSKFPLVTVIIPTRNSQKYIEMCLKSIENQVYEKIEVIVVDNNSSDQTKKIAKKSTNHIYNIGPERGAQINFGVKKAHGKYIYFTGPDLIVSKNFIKEAVEKCENTPCDAIYINVITKIKNPNIWQKVRILERKLYFKESGVSVARFLRKKAFIKIGGLEESFGGIAGDFEFQNRLDKYRFKTCFINSSEYNLDEWKSLKTIMSKSLYYGWLLKKYRDKYPEKTKKQYTPIRNEFIKHKDILFKDKPLLVFFILYKIIQYSFGSFGLLLSIISMENKNIQDFFYKLNYQKR